VEQAKAFVMASIRTKLGNSEQNGRYERLPPGKRIRLRPR
jgi:hypothetical protein